MLFIIDDLQIPLETLPLVRKRVEAAGFTITAIGAGCSGLSRSFIHSLQRAA